MMDAIAARVAGGETIEFRPTGNSMVPLIQSRQNVKVEPVDATKVEVGDIVLVRVACGCRKLHPARSSSLPVLMDETVATGRDGDWRALPER
jgi:hypothetical protein